MTSGMRTMIYPVRDLTRAKRLFSSLLGAGPQMDEAYYVGFSVGGQHLGLDPHGHDRGMTGPVGYWHVADINASLSGLQADGAEVQQPVTDVGGGRLVAAVKDADGNVIGLIQGE